MSKQIGLGKIFKELVRRIKVSLNDIDKNNDDRANPALNADDNVLKRNSHETIGTSYRRTGGNVTQAIAFQQGAIKGYDSTGRTNLFFGYNPSISALYP